MIELRGISKPKCFVSNWLRNVAKTEKITYINIKLQYQIIQLKELILL